MKNLKIRINEKCVYSDIEGKTIILNVETGKYLELNSTATKIWELMEKYQDFMSILNGLVEEFDASEQQLKEDLKEFVTESEEKGLIIIGD